MIKSRTTQLIFQSMYCALGLAGIVACLGIYEDYTNLRWEFYVYFTNLSNFFCIFVMLAELIATAKKRDRGYVTTLPILKFIGLLGILLTFLVFNIMLAGAEGRDPQMNWRIGSLLFHVVLPILYILDWFLFYERGNTKWYYPLVSISFPLTYFFFIMIQAAVMDFDTSILIPGTETPLIYPYFFVNLETQGVGGVVKWVIILLAAFVAAGYIFFLLDKLFKSRKKAE